MSIRVIAPQRHSGSLTEPVRTAVSRALGSQSQAVGSMLGDRTSNLPPLDFSGVRIHASTEAAHSARILSARGYTACNHVVLDAERFPLTTESGRRVLAHELVHAAGEPESTAVPASVADSDSVAEREASAIARGALGSEPNAAIRRWRTQSTSAIQRDLLVYSREHIEILPGSTGEEGGFTGTTYAGDAAAVRAALGALIRAGTVTTRATRDGVIFSAAPTAQSAVQTALASFARSADMAAGMVDAHQLSLYAHEEVTKYYGLWPVELDRRSNVIERQSARPLTAAERAEASLVFGAGLDYDPIRLEEDPVMSVGGYARTTPWNINFPSGSFGRIGFMPWLIHELTHMWQYQHGVSLATTLYHSIFSTYSYGGETGLLAATAAGRHLRDFNTEQQGDIARDYYVRQKTGMPTAAWTPFIAEFQVP